MDDDFKPVRRRLLKALGITLPVSTAVFADAQHPPTTRPSPGQSAASTPGSDAAEHVSLFFNVDERAAVDAIVARLIPADELGPGAKEAGVTTFLDRQLAGTFGQGANFYRHGPFQQGTPEQGYQLALTPAECYRLGLAGLDRVCKPLWRPALRAARCRHAGRHAARGRSRQARPGRRAERGVLPGVA